MKPFRNAFHEKITDTIRHIKTTLSIGSQPSVGRSRNRIHSKNPRMNFTISSNSPIISDLIVYT
ncbi:MAG: hypothetical protein ISS16_12060 [Ignavibacteria bacterium]|nr:hypothetical protein [Ignavibacteria bacterium]